MNSLDTKKRKYNKYFCENENTIYSLDKSKTKSIVSTLNYKLY